MYLQLKMRIINKKKTIKNQTKRKMIKNDYFIFRNKYAYLSDKFYPIKFNYKL